MKQITVLIMGEMGFDTEGDKVPPFIMTGLGIPGGEHALEELYIAQGIGAVADQFNKTLPVITAHTGKEVAAPDQHRRPSAHVPRARNRLQVD
jgi:hypothetical protein